MRNRPSELHYRVNFPMKFTVTSKHLQSTGFGMLVDISSKGLTLRAETGLLPGMTVSASIAWPYGLGDQCSLQLCVEGRVSRVDGSLVEVSIDRYEFRTAAKGQPNEKYEGMIIIEPVGPGPLICW